MSSTISYRSASYSKSQVVKLTHTWTIDNYSLRFDENFISPISPISISSSQFLAPDFGFASAASNSKYQFKLSLRPNKQAYDFKNHLSVFLEEVSGENFLPIIVKCKFAIVSAKGDKYFPKEVQRNLHCCRGDRWKVTILGGENFYSQSELLSKAELLLPDDKLTIVAEISYLTNRETLIRSANTFEDYANLWKNGKLFDVVLNVSGTEFRAHKTVLGARSPVFCAMFEHDLEEKQQNRVEIPDVNPEVFQQLLSYIYTGKIDSIEKNAQDLFVASDKYQLMALKSHCEQYLITKVSVETSPNLLLLADSYNAHKLKAAVLEVMKSQSNEAFQAMVKANPELLVDMFRYLADKSEKLNNNNK